MQETHTINIIADIGNSNTKFSCFDRVFFNLEDLIEYIQVNEEESKVFQLFIFSTIKDKSNFVKQEIEAKLKIDKTQIFNSQEQEIIKNLYEGIGDDRVAKLIGAQNYFPNKNIILVDFGTATTISVINKHSEFVGGFISLGFTSSLKALSDYCDALEDYSNGKFIYENNYKDIEAQNTKKSIINGTINAHIGLVNQWLFKAKNILKNSLCADTATITVCTGRDSSLFIKYFDTFLYDYELLEACVKSLAC